MFKDGKGIRGITDFSKIDQELRALERIGYSDEQLN